MAKDVQNLSRETELPAELSELSQDFEHLADCCKSVSFELPQVERLVSHLLASRASIEFNADQIKVLPVDQIEVLPNEYQGPPIDVVQSALLLEQAYPLLVQHVKEAIRLRDSVESTLAAIPDPMVARLPDKNGSPWRSHYLRECLDVLDKWPSDVKKSMPFLSPLINAGELVGAVLPKPYCAGFPLHQRFEYFSSILNEALFEIRSLRFDLNSCGSNNREQVEDGSNNCGGDSKRRQGVKQSQPRKKTIERIELIQKGLSTSEILERLKVPRNEWNREGGNIRQIRSRWKRGRYGITTGINVTNSDKL